MKDNMTVISITINDESNPAELQTWFDENPSIVPKFMFNDGRIFFIIY